MTEYVQLAAVVVLAAAALQCLLLLWRSARRLRAERLAKTAWASFALADVARRDRLRQIEVERSERSWRGIRKFDVARRVEECENVCSFYLQPHDGKPLPPFLPGQHLTFHVRDLDWSERVTRCYSLSDRPEDEGRFYRVTIKRAPPVAERKSPRPGEVSVSNYFHDRVRPGDILDVEAPRGDFWIDETRDSPVVLIAGGVGTTPMFAMLQAILRSGSPRQVWFYQGVTSSRDQVFGPELRALAAAHDNVTLRAFYSRPSDAESEGEHYDAKGYVTVQQMKEDLGSTNHDFYICGPPPMMTSVVEGLQEWGVPESRVHMEAFGPASVMVPRGKVGAQIEFKKSGKTAAWTKDCKSVLELAHAAGVNIQAGCWTGQCGRCETAVVGGEFDTSKQATWKSAPNCFVPCSSVPMSDLVVDA